MARKLFKLFFKLPSTSPNTIFPTFLLSTKLPTSLTPIIGSNYFSIPSTSISPPKIIHLSLYPFFHSPYFFSPLMITTPFPCYFPYNHPPMYLRPSGHSCIPFPSFLSLLNSPIYFLPSDHSNTPLPCILLSIHIPSYLL